MGRPGPETVLEAATGEVRWQVARGDEIPGGGGAAVWPVNSRLPTVGVPVVDLDGGDWEVVAGYHTSSSDPLSSGEFGVVALSGSDGRVLWKRPLVQPPANPAANDSSSSIRSVLSDGTNPFVVAVQPGPPRDLDSPEDLAALRFVALDGRTGAIRWEHPGFEALGIADDLVVGAVAGDGRSGPLNLAATALDTATGRPRSQAFDGFAWALPRKFAGHYALGLTAEDADGAGETTLVDLSSGDARGTLGRGDQAQRCASDGELIACAALDDRSGAVRLATFDASAGAGTVSEKRLASELIDGVWHDGAFVRKDPQAEDAAGTSELVDRAGEVMQEVPGQFVAGSDRYVLMRTGTLDHPAFEVYRTAQ